MPRKRPRTITSAIADALDATLDCQTALAAIDLRQADHATRGAVQEARRLANSQGELLAQALRLDAERLYRMYPFRHERAATG